MTRKLVSMYSYILSIQLNNNYFKPMGRTVFIAYFRRQATYRFLKVLTQNPYLAAALFKLFRNEHSFQAIYR